jgi:hypothetical protein
MMDGSTARRLAELVASPPDRPELILRLLELVCDLCLEVGEETLSAAVGWSPQALTLANQMILGLLFHSVGSKHIRADSERLQWQLEEQLRQLHAAREQGEAQRRRLRLVEADLNTLQEERRLLDAIAAHEALRQKLSSEQEEREAYLRLLATAAGKASRQQAELETLSRQAQTTLERLRQLLYEELIAEEQAWQGVEREVFGT